MILSGNRITPETGQKPTLLIKIVLQNLVGRALMDTCARIDDVPSFLSPELAAFMHRVDIGAGDDWDAKRFSDVVLSIPGGVHVRCGYCNVLQNLKCTDPVYNPDSKTMVLKGSCINSQCRSISTVLLVGPCSHSAASNGKEFWILPKPELRKARLDKSKILDSDMLDAYEEAVDAFNNGKWRQTATECGRILEGIVETQFTTEAQQRCLQNITGSYQHSISQKDGESDDDFNARKLEEETKRLLFSPILKLSSAIRRVRNSGSHFNRGNQVDESAAKEILDLSEHAMEYFLLLSDAADSVKSRFPR